MNRLYAFVFLVPLWLSVFASIAAAADNAPLEVESVVLRLVAEAEVPAQEAGLILAVAVREGQQVKQGDVLAQLDDEVPRLAAAAAQLQFEISEAKATNDVRLRYAQKALEVSEAELRRSTESVERFPKSVSESQLDVERLTVQKNRLEVSQAIHEQEVAKLEMKSKDHERTAARAQVARRRIAAPFDGVIVQVRIRQGEWAEAGQQAMRIVNANRLKAEGFVPAARATSALIGRSVRLTVEMGDQPAASFPGTIVFVSPEVDPITGQVRVWAEIDNKEGKLRPGQPARMAVISP